MVRARSEFTGSDPLINPVQHLDINVAALVNASQVADEILRFHSLLWLQVGCVQVGVEEDDGKGHDEYRVSRVEFAERKKAQC